MEKKYEMTTKAGIWYFYGGDVIVWLWPWNRLTWKEKWFSTIFFTAFESLEDLDIAWYRYWESIGW